MDHSENTLRAVVKSLSDAVAPAVDPGDPLANEQLRLVVDYLEFLRSRLDDLHTRERFELRHHLRLAESVRDLAGQVSASTAGELTAAIDQGSAVYDRPGATTGEIRQATRSLAAALRVLIRQAATAEEGVRRQIELRITDGTGERVEFERSWYLPYGFDPEASSVTPLEKVLSSVDNKP